MESCPGAARMTAIGPEVGGWVRKTAVPLKSMTAGAGFEDLAPLREWIGDARVVGLGEATHDTREFFQIKHRLFEYLVYELGFTLFTIEAPFPESLAINHYIQTGEGDARHGLMSLNFYCWDTEEVLELVEWMRRWNAAHERRVFFYGYDIQSSAPSIIFLLEYLEKHAPDAYRRMRPALEPLAIETQIFDWLGRSEAENARATLAIAELTAAVIALEAETDEQRVESAIARLHASVLNQNTQMRAANSLNDSFTVRDRAMAENIESLLNLHGPQSKAVAWAHNGHIALRSSGQFSHVSTPTMGQHLREKFGKGYMAFGFAFDHGSFGGLDENDRVQEWTVPTAPGSLDAALSEAGLPAFIVDLGNVPPDVAANLAQAPASRSISGIYYPALDARMWTEFNPRELFDALVFVNETSAAHHNLLAPYLTEFVREDPPHPEGFLNFDFSQGIQGWKRHAQPSVGAYEVCLTEDGADHHSLELARSEELWPYDVFAISQTSSALPWRSRRVVMRCCVSIEAARNGSSAQLAMRVLKDRGAAPTQPDFSADRSRRFVWQRVATCSRDPQELELTVWVDEAADTISVALVMTGDGRARFGPVSITADR
jgi:erythromycin esterase